MSTIWNRRGVVYSVAALVAVVLYLAAHQIPPAYRIGLLPSSTLPACDPYTQPGFLNYDPAKVHANRWTPYSPSCAAPALVASFLRSSWAKTPPSVESKAGSGFQDQPTGPNGMPWVDTQWARGKTVLVLGDSVTRFMTDYMCQLAGEQGIEIALNHTWAEPLVEAMPPPVPEADRVPEEELRAVATDNNAKRKRSPAVGSGSASVDWSKVHPGKTKSHRPHYCYVPGMDFLMVHVMFFGLDQKEYWKDKESANPPYTFEDRIDMTAVPVMERIRETTGRTPDLTYVHSGLWDLSRFVREDMTSGQNPEHDLSAGRLKWYRKRARQVMVHAAEAFPRTTLKWASTHYPLRVSNGWFFEGKKPEIKLNRLVAMHEAAVSAIQDTEDATPPEREQLRRYSMNPWGLLMRGAEQLQIDDLHPALLPGGYLWADLMLYDLNKARSSWMPWEW